MRDEPAAAEAGVTLQQPEARHAFSRGSCPQIMGAWPQKRRIVSGPLLVLGGRLRLCLILLPDGKIE